MGTHLRTAITALLLVAALRAEETWNYKADIYGSFSGGRFYHGDNYWGSGVGVGAGFGIRPFPGVMRRMGLEARAHTLHFSRSSGLHSSGGDAASLTGGILWHFGNARTQPYLLTELGVMRTRFTLEGVSDWYESNPDGSLGPHHVERWTEHGEPSEFLFGFGGGVKIRVGRNVYLRPEVQVGTTTPGRGWNFETLRLSIGGGYFW